MLENKDYVSSFMEKNSATISKMGRTVYNHSEVGSLAFKTIVKSALDNAYISYNNKERESDYLDSYLYGALRIANLKLTNENKSSALICPGCKENNHIEVLLLTSSGLCCSNCSKASNSNLLQSTFAIHSSVGYRCPDCSKFIPRQKGDSLRCPYNNCKFEGLQSSLKKMSHPEVHIARKESIANIERIPSQISSEIIKLSANEEVDRIYAIINECIDDQIKVLHFKGFPATYNIKLCMYKAFRSTLDKFPEETIPYFSCAARCGGGSKMQAKILQEFIFHLENSLPFSYTQKGEEFRISSLLDERLKIFDGESVFNAEINEQFEIPNLTQEIYIGGRGGYYCLPYYIGKLLDIKDIETGRSLLNDVREYGSTKISMNNNTKVGTKVMVNHLRIIPHYYSGGFVHLNRLKKILVEKVQIRLKSL